MMNGISLAIENWQSKSKNGSMICFTLNGESRSLPETLTVAELLDRLGYDRRRIAVEVNREVVPLPRHGEHRLQSGDGVDLVTPLGRASAEPAPPAAQP